MRSLIWAANPVGEIVQGENATADASMMKIVIAEFCEAPVGEPVMVPGTIVSLMKRAN